MPNGTRNDGGAMYIKATKTHTDRDGQPVRSHRLVLSQRVGDRVRHRTLLNLGTDYPVPKERWKTVTGLAEALLLGRPPLLEAAPDVRAAAEDIVARLRTRGFRSEAMQEEARKPDIATGENIGWLGERGYDWIAVSRGARPPEGGPEALLITSAQQEVRAARGRGRRGAARLQTVAAAGHLPTGYRRKPRSHIAPGRTTGMKSGASCNVARCRLTEIPLLTNAPLRKVGSVSPL